MDTLLADLSNDPINVEPVVSDADLREWALSHYDYFLIMSGKDESQAIDMLGILEPFKTHWDRTEEILVSERSVNV